MHCDPLEYGESSSSTGLSNVKALELKTLPPVLLDVSLPPTYPFTPPQIRKVYATQGWLPLNSHELQEYLATKWEEGVGVLYTWVECIRSGEFLDDLHMTFSENGKRVVRYVFVLYRKPRSNRSVSIAHPSPGLLLPALEHYDRSTEAAQFSQNSYECQVCLTSIKGARCIMLSCSHVFCRSCLEDFWGLCIKEGDVGRVGCPDPGCVKAHREATEEEVRRVATEEEVLRWKWLSMKRALEKGEELNPLIKVSSINA